MPRVTAPPLPEHCPWGGFTPPNVDWCEEQLCSIVVNPADTWSNVLYIVLGVWMWRETRRMRAGRAAASGLDLFGPSAIAVGVFSLTYHASYTYLLQFFDFVGMFLFCFAVITAAALRLQWITPERRFAFLAAGTLGFSALVPIVSETALPIQALVGLLIAAIIGQEGILWARERRAATPVDHRLFLLALALMAGAAAASAADVTRSWCNPSNHFLQGHSIWHLLSAAALYALYRFYAALPTDAQAHEGNRDG